MPRRSAAQTDLEEQILHWEARATRACADGDRESEWLAECRLWELYEARAALSPPSQRKPSP